jgi:glucans biosynthesis protein C
MTTTHMERLHGLDALRGFALLAGVVLHATMSFLPGFGAVGWPITDNSPSTTLGLTFFVIHIFRMTTFFVVAGFFGRLLLQRDGVRGFIRNRAKRIVVPMVSFWILLMPLLIGAMVWGAYKTNGGQLPPPPQQPPNSLWFPLAHLWFLYVLTWLYAATLLVRGAIDRVDRGGRVRATVDRVVHGVASRWWGFIALAAPLTIALATYPGWALWFGVPTPDQSLVTNLPASVAFGTGFAFGWLVHRQLDILRTWEQRSAVNAVLAVGFTVACVAMRGITPSFVTAAPGAWTWVYAACYAAAVWTWGFALLGGALRFFAAPSPSRRYIADSSYWIYLMHLPVVFFLQVAVQDAPLHWSVKFPLVLGVALALLFGSYHYLVRPTFIGALLNGRCYPRRSAPQGSSPSPAPAALGDVSAANLRFDLVAWVHAAAVGSRSGTHPGWLDGERRLARVRRARAARRASGLHALLVRRAPQHGQHRELGARGADRACCRAHLADPRRLRRHHAAEPRTAPRGGDLSHARSAASRPHRSRLWPGARHRSDDRPRAAVVRR